MLSNFDKAAFDLAQKNSSKIGDLSTKKAEKAYVDTELGKKANQSDLQNISKGSPKGVYATLTALQTALPMGDSNIYVVTADGKWYYWNGTAWTAGGVYQSSGIADSVILNRNIVNDTIEAKKIFDVVENGKTYKKDGIVLFSKSVGKYVVGKVGTYSSGVFSINDNASYYFSDPIEIVTGTPLIFSKVRVGTAAILFDANDNAIGAITISSSDTLENYTRTVSSASVKYIRLNIYIDNIDTFTLTGTKNFNQYKINWLDSLNTIIKPSMFGKKGLSFGDSIMAQDSKNFSYSNVVYNSEKLGQYCYGYQSYLRDLYKVSITDYAVGGQGITEQTDKIVNGGIDYSIYDFVIIGLGVNNFTGGSQLGSLPTQQLDSNNYDSTFIGRFFRAISYIKSQNPNIKILLMTPLHRDTTYKTDGTGTDIYSTNSAGYKLSDYRNAIINIGEMTGSVVVDMYKESGLNKWNLPTYTFEGVHPTNECYSFIVPPLLRGFEKL